MSAWASWGLWEPTRLDNLTAPSKLLVLKPESPPGGSLVRPHSRGWPFLGTQGLCKRVMSSPIKPTPLGTPKRKKKQSTKTGAPGTRPGSIPRGRDKKWGEGVLQLRSETVFS